MRIKGTVIYLLLLLVFSGCAAANENTLSKHDETDTAPENSLSREEEEENAAELDVSKEEKEENSNEVAVINEEPISFEDKKKLVYELVHKQKTSEYNVNFNGTFGIHEYEPDSLFDFYPFEDLEKEELVFKGEAAVSQGLIEGVMNLAHSNLEFNELMPFAMIHDLVSYTLYVENEAYLTHRQNELESDYPEFYEEFHYYYENEENSVGIYELDTFDNFPSIIPEIIHPLRIKALKHGLYDFALINDLFKDEEKDELSFNISIEGDRVTNTGMLEMDKEVKEIFIHLANAVLAAQDHEMITSDTLEDEIQYLIQDTNVHNFIELESLFVFEDNSIKKESLMIEFADIRMGNSIDNTLVYHMEINYENNQPVSFSSSMNEGVNTTESNVFYWNAEGNYQPYNSIINTEDLFKNTSHELSEIFIILEPILKTFDKMIELED